MKNSKIILTETAPPKDMSKIIRLAPIEECPHGGDNTDCKSCTYYPDYQWDNEELDCMRKVECKYEKL